MFWLLLRERGVRLREDGQLWLPMDCFSLTVSVIVGDHSISQPTNSERYLSCTRQWTCAKKCIFFMILSSAPSISTNARICSSISSWHPKNCLASSCHQSKCLDIKEMHGGASIDIHSDLKPAVLACYHVSRFPQKVWVSASHQKFPDHPVIIHMPHEGGCVKLVWKVESLDRYI